MIKSDAAIMQTVFQDEEVEVSAERRALLACKGQRLYDKYCGTKGRGICAESFAEYHIWRGEWVVARDFLVYLGRFTATVYPLCASFGSTVTHDRTPDRADHGAAGRCIEIHFQHNHLGRQFMALNTW